MKKIMFIGAHPDDGDIRVGGVAIQMARAGHRVRFVSMTDGCCGHQTMSRKDLAMRRLGEAKAAAKASGMEAYDVLCHPDGELEPTLENRRELIRLIRAFAPDVVITHRLCDYHPDHRATAQLVQDTAYVLMVPHFCDDAPVPEKAPVYAFCYDPFLEPRPLRIDAAVEFDSVLDEKLDVMNCHESQFYEWLPWIDGLDFDNSTADAAARRRHLMTWLQPYKENADKARDILQAAYGKEKGASIKYAEVFEQSCYSRVLPRDEFQRLLMP